MATTLDDETARRDRRALASVAVQFFANGAIFASFVPRLPEIRDRIDIGVGALGALLAAGSAFGLLGSLTVGRAVERIGSRRVLIGGASVLVGMLLLVAAAETWIVLGIALAGLSAFDVYVDSAMNLQGSWLSARRSTPVMNRLHGLWSLGTVVGGLVAARAAASGVSLRVHLVVVAVALAIVLLYVGRGLLREDEPEVEAPTESTPADRVGPTSPARAGGVTRRALIALGVAGGASIVIEMTSSDWAAFRLSDDLGQSPGVAGLGFVAFTAGMTVGRLTGDSVLVRVGQTRLFVGGIVATVVGLLAATLVASAGVVIAGYLVAGLGVATQFPRLYDQAAQTAGRRGAGLGALTAGSRIAMLVAPLLVGTLAGTSLSVGASVALVVLPATAVFAVVARPRVS